MLTDEPQTIADAEWNIFLRAAGEKRGKGLFFFAHRLPADVSVAHADGFLRLENGEPLLFFENQQVKFMGLLSAMVSFDLPKGGDITRGFKPTKECFQNERRELEEGGPAAFQQCQSARLQINEEHKSIQAHFAAANGEKTTQSSGFTSWKVKSTDARARQKRPGRQRSVRG
ncbi:hypothetical protein ERJ75_001424500 [Trypanosoma vivax]|nr:hypothetical protein ERJ75_001424500 [Trypanosoma vivax]